MSKRLKRHAMHYVDPVCVECGGMGVMTSGERAYPHRRDNWGKIYFQCPCGAIVGCHPGTAVPAGRPASTHTRALRYRAHELFDRRWGRGERSPHGYGYARQKAYKWLADFMGVPLDEAHIGLFDADQCNRLIAACQTQGADT